MSESRPVSAFFPTLIDKVPVEAIGVCGMVATSPVAEGRAEFATEVVGLEAAEGEFSGATVSGFAALAGIGDAFVAGCGGAPERAVVNRMTITARIKATPAAAITAIRVCRRLPRLGRGSGEASLPPAIAGLGAAPAGSGTPVSRSLV